ncbi:MAG: B12-binding domain-containing radical SAM protein, partial [Phycisphaerae bacterium]|nr:B12-binding domain-containing radical SAM protein [Phycisphaerae bacterium]
MIDLRQRVSQELLPFVRQPAQYIGGEVNSCVRDWAGADVRIALAFPDTYALGMSHLGSAILYAIANRTPGVACERVYSPWLDAEQIMRSRSIPLFTWESRQPVASADIVAITLQYEMNFTNVLNLLDLAGIPLHSADRLANKEDSPLVIAGGPQADNPEPLADFIDLFVIGDGEAAFPAIIDAYRDAKKRGISKREFLIEFARAHDWAYVPSLYDVTYNPDGTIAAIQSEIRNPKSEMVVRCR